MNSENTFISVVSTMYRSEKHIEKFIDLVNEQLIRLTNVYEIILVDDGSPDLSTQIAIAKAQKHAYPVKIVSLTRNFGQHKALLAGLSQAKGEFIFMMDSDLEESPDLISEFWRISKKDSQFDVYFGYQPKRRKGYFDQILGNLFYKTFNFLSGLNSVPNPTPFRLMSKRYVEDLLKHEEKEFFFLGVSIITGYSQKAIPIEKSDKGESSYSPIKRLNQLIEAIISFSSKPLYYIFYLGILITSGSIILILITLYKYLTGSIGTIGWTSMIISIWFVGGITTFCIGLIGIYISKIFTETKKRPQFLIKDITICG